VGGGGISNSRGTAQGGGGGGKKEEVDILLGVPQSGAKEAGAKTSLAETRFGLELQLKYGRKGDESGVKVSQCGP